MKPRIWAFTMPAESTGSGELKETVIKFVPRLGRTVSLWEYALVSSGLTLPSPGSGPAVFALSVESRHFANGRLNHESKEPPREPEDRLGTAAIALGW